MLVVLWVKQNFGCVVPKKVMALIFCWNELLPRQLRTTMYNITCDLLKKVPGQLEPKKLTNQHFYKKTLIKKNQSFKIQISNSSSVLPIDVEKNEIYTNNCLGSMLVSYYVSQHARLATAASTIPSGFWEAGSLGTSYERMRAGCKLYSTLKMILFYGKKGLLGFSWVPCW